MATNNFKFTNVHADRVTGECRGVIRRGRQVVGYFIFNEDCDKDVNGGPILEFSGSQQSFDFEQAAAQVNKSYEEYATKLIEEGMRRNSCWS